MARSWMKREWSPHRSFRVSDRIVPLPSFPRVATEHARDTRVYHHHYRGGVHYHHPPPLRRRITSTVTIVRWRERFSPLPLLSFAPLYRFTFPSLHTRDDSTSSDTYSTFPSPSIWVARLPPSSAISPSLAAHNSTHALSFSLSLSLSLSLSHSACKWFERARTLIPLQAKRCEAHGE